MMSGIPFIQSDLSSLQTKDSHSLIKYKPAQKTTHIIEGRAKKCSSYFFCEVLCEKEDIKENLSNAWNGCFLAVWLSRMMHCIAREFLILQSFTWIDGLCLKSRLLKMHLSNQTNVIGLICSTTCPTLLLFTLKTKRKF